ncbi:MAG: hypothetical protein KAR06_05545, partial [Deltaproteobacteria bacterium]|nr:hypothetical protein [Deltaproteobacteria bacterium]
MESVADIMLIKAKYSLPYNGIPESRNGADMMNNCRGFYMPLGVMLIFTRDEGMHDAGWWKNPDYARCYHLSISFKDPATGVPIPFNKK